MTTAYDFTANTIDGKPAALDVYKGKVALVVNVASKCGLTPQYEGLEKLYEKFQDKGFVVLGFPCNQFHEQEPGSESEIEEFCSLNYGVKFPLFSKIEVNGPDAHPLYQFLRQQQPGAAPTAEQLETDKLYQFLNKSHPDYLRDGTIPWNFTKFLIDRNGKVLKRFGPTETPEQIESEIQAAINA